jgi:ribosomal protein S18 acetylase RimI-like enzyme
VSVSVRAVSAEDAQDLAEFSAAAFRNTYEPFLNTAAIDAVVAQSFTYEAFQRLVQHNAAGVGLSCLLVAVDGAELVGFLDFAEEDDGLELRRLYTRVGGTSRGVGASLLAALEGALPANTRYRIVVLPDNVRGLQFWQRHGFRVRGEVDGIDHFRGHRGVVFAPTATASRLLVLDREVGADEQASS